MNEEHLCRFCEEPSDQDVVLANNKREDMTIPCCDHCAKVLLVIASHIGGRISDRAQKFDRKFDR